MVLVLITLLADQLLIFWSAGISLMTFFCVVPKVMFVGRVMGSVIQWKILLTLETVGFVSWILWRGFIVHNMTLKQFLIYLILEIVSVLIYVIDENMFVYVSEDVD